MKINKILFFVLLLMGCKTQTLYEYNGMNQNVKIKPGQCYIAITEKSSNKKNENNRSYLLEAIPPKYKKVNIKYTEQELKKHEIKDGIFSIPIRKHHLKFLFKDVNLREFTKMEPPEGYAFCLVDVPAIIKSYTKEELLNSDYIVEVQQITENTKILKTIKKNKPKKLSSNQYYANKGNWKDLQIINSNDSGCRSYSMKTIEQKLIELGYDIEINNKMDDIDKKALTDFQQKNGLKVGQLDFDTLQKLGLIKE